MTLSSAMDVSIKQSITERIGDLDFICKATVFNLLITTAAQFRFNSFLILGFNLNASSFKKKKNSLQITTKGCLLSNYADVFIVY